MVKPSKLYARIVANPRAGHRFRDFERVLLAFGFCLDRIAGSHRQYVHRDVSRPLSVQPRGKDAKSYQIEMFIDMVEEFGLTIEE